MKELFLDDLKKETLWKGSILETAAPFARLEYFDSLVTKRIAAMERCPDLEPAEVSMLAALRRWKADVWG